MLSIIIPTYNESEVILDTINKIKKAIPKHQKYEIIICDDNSPDRTWELVNKTFSKNKSIRALRRMTNRGLSPAVIDGYKEAKGDYFLVMDGDGQHDEKIIPEMIKKIQHADIVCGTRFSKSGSVSNWSKKRVFISKSAALLSRPFIKQRISDPMSGFFMIRKELFKAIKHKLDAQGFKIYLDILFKAPKARVAEVGYTFRTREKGESKLSSKVMFQYINMLRRAFTRKYSTFIKFCFVGGTGVLVNMGLLALLTEVGGFYYLASSAIAIETSIITNFILNNSWTWKKRNKNNSTIKRFFQFNLVSLLALVINMGTLYSLVEFFGLHYIIANLVGIALGTIINFFVNDKWTFKEKKK